MAPAPDGTVWYTGQLTGVLGRLDPKTGGVERIPLGKGSAPHGVIVGPDGAAWVTDSGQNAIVRVDPMSKEVKGWPLPASRGGANLNTAAFDGKGRIWFTGQTGIYGRHDPATGKMDVWDAPKGVGPYGITATPSGDIYYVSLAGSFLGKPDLETGETTVIEPKTKDAGTRRVWSDSKGHLWVSEWNVGNLSVYDPAFWRGRGSFRSWRCRRRTGAMSSRPPAFYDPCTQMHGVHGNGATLQMARSSTGRRLILLCSRARNARQSRAGSCRRLSPASP